MGQHPATIADARRFFRVVTVAHELLDELHVRSLDDSGRQRLAHLFDQVLVDAEEVLPEPLGVELAVLAARLDEYHVTDGELRIALAELVGWLDGTIASTPLMVPADADGDQASFTTAYQTRSAT